MLLNIPVNDSHLDPDNPKDALIIAQRETYLAWQTKIAEFAPANSDSAIWQIEPVSIYEDHGISRSDLTIRPTPSPLTERVKSHLLEVYNRRGLFFPTSQAFAIADPDEIDRSEQRLVYQGILSFAAISYDLRVSVVLTKGFDEEQFDFFFALKLLKIPIMKMDDFFEFHLNENFESNRSKFVRFLRLLQRYISEELSGLDHTNDWDATSDGWKASLEEWLDLDLARIESKIVSGADLPPTSDDQGMLPGTQKPIQDDINAAHFRKALNALKTIKNKNEGPIISDEDLVYLKEQGPYINLTDNHRKIQLDLSRNDKAKVYSFFHWMWSKFATAKNRGIRGYAEYLACYFQDFADLQLESIVKSIEPPSLFLKQTFDDIYTNTKD